MIILIENLNKTVTSNDLSSLMSDLKGYICSAVKLDKYGMSAGIGYAHFEKRIDGDNAIKKCNGFRLFDREIRVSQSVTTPISIFYKVTR